VESSDEAIISTTLEGYILSWNAGAERLFGYAAEEIVGREVATLVPPEHASDLDRFPALLRSGERVSRFETVCTRKDGSSVDVLVSISPIHDKHGTVAGASAIVRDVTKRKRAEEAIRASEQRYRLLFERNLAGVCRATLDGRFLDCNDAYARILGYESREEILAQPVLSVYFDPAEREAYWAKLRERGTLSNYELRLRRKDGCPVWVLANDTRLEGDVEGQLVKEATLMDITERKRAEAALIEERHLLHTLMDNLPDVIYFKDRESRFTRINKAHARVFGLSDPAQAVGKTDFDFFTDEHAQQAYADEQEIIRTSQPVLSKEEKETWPDGRETWASTTKMPLRDANGNIIGTFGISRDVTAHKQVEVTMQKAMRAAEEANRTKSEFLANISHELRTPMNAVIGMTELALARDLNSEQRRYLELAESSANSLMALINDILDFSEIDRRELELETTPFSLAEAVDEALRPLSIQAYRKGLEMAYGVSPTIPSALLGDAVRLKQTW
jgi:PAS domain S-box-containing protein